MGSLVGRVVCLKGLKNGIDGWSSCGTSDMIAAEPTIWVYACVRAAIRGGELHPAMLYKRSDSFTTIGMNLRLVSRSYFCSNPNAKRLSSEYPLSMLICKCHVLPQDAALRVAGVAYLGDVKREQEVMSPIMAIE